MSSTAVMPSQAPFRNAAIECTHCHQLVRLGDVPIRMLPTPVTEVPVSSPVKLSGEFSPRSPDSDSATDTEEPASSPTKAEETEASKWRWSQELKDHFVRAFDTLQNRGIHATPKKIMGLMRQNGAPIEQLTMRRVQSHHQKYLKRLRTNKLGGKKTRQAPKPLVVKSEASDSVVLSDRFDLEVSRLTANIESAGSCHTSPRGSPMIFSVQTPPSNIRVSQASPPMSYGHVMHKASMPINVVRPQSTPPPLAAHMSSVNQTHFASRPVKFNPELFSSLAQQNPSAVLPYMMSGTVVKPAVEKPVPHQFTVSSSSAFSIKLAPGPSTAAAHLDELSARASADPESSIFGGLVDHSFAIENSILDTLPTADLDLTHIDDLFPEASDSPMSSDDDSFDFLGFINDDGHGGSALDVASS